MNFLNINGPIVANTVYVNRSLVARDVEATLAGVTPMTADVEAMGTMALPIWQRLEDMTASITKIGLDLGLRAMITPDPLKLELRFLQDVTDANMITKQMGCKAFLTGIPTNIPGFSITPGELSSNEITLTVIRYQLYVDGAELFLIDRLAGIVVIGGKDYTREMNSFL